jgi:hypothetical protein
MSHTFMLHYPWYHLGYTSTIWDVSSTLSFFICHDNQFYVQNVITCQCRHWIFSLTQLAELERIRQITIRTCIWMFFYVGKGPDFSSLNICSKGNHSVLVWNETVVAYWLWSACPSTQSNSWYNDRKTFNPVLKCPIVSPAIFQVEDCLILKHGPWYMTIISVNLVYVASLRFSFVSLRF